jgi:hypothetical protein
MSTFAERFQANPEQEIPKIIFATCAFVFYLLVVFIMYFVIMYKGWGLSVQSWGWMIFLWLINLIVGGISQVAKTAVKKVDGED